MYYNNAGAPGAFGPNAAYLLGAGPPPTQLIINSHRSSSRKWWDTWWSGWSLVWSGTLETPLIFFEHQPEDLKYVLCSNVLCKTLLQVGEKSVLNNLSWLKLNPALSKKQESTPVAALVAPFAQPVRASAACWTFGAVGSSAFSSGVECWEGLGQAMASRNGQMIQYRIEWVQLPRRRRRQSTLQIKEKYFYCKTEATAKRKESTAPPRTHTDPHLFVRAFVRMKSDIAVVAKSDMKIKSEDRRKKSEGKRASSSSSSIRYAGSGRCFEREACSLFDGWKADPRRRSKSKPATGPREHASFPSLKQTGGGEGRAGFGSSAADILARGAVHSKLFYCGEWQFTTPVSYLTAKHKRISSGGFQFRESIHDGVGISGKECMTEVRKLASLIEWKVGLSTAYAWSIYTAFGRARTSCQHGIYQESIFAGSGLKRSSFGSRLDSGFGEICLPPLGPRRNVSVGDNPFQYQGPCILDFDSTWRHNQGAVRLKLMLLNPSTPERTAKILWQLRIRDATTHSEGSRTREERDASWAWLEAYLEATKAKLCCGSDEAKVRFFKVDETRRELTIRRKLAAWSSSSFGRAKDLQEQKIGFRNHVVRGRTEIEIDRRFRIHYPNWGNNGRLWREDGAHSKLTGQWKKIGDALEM
ncbi:hypothetical protein B0H19DRAFT_1069740 [Mycena capillaripes]|nr:hypothetical protein B0H19DRAFT_1069740 [Mycena capillaripes]